MLEFKTDLDFVMSVTMPLSVVHRPESKSHTKLSSFLATDDVVVSPNFEFVCYRTGLIILRDRSESTVLSRQIDCRGPERFGLFYGRAGDRLFLAIGRFGCSSSTSIVGISNSSESTVNHISRIDLRPV